MRILLFTLTFLIAISFSSCKKCIKCIRPVACLKCSFIQNDFPDFELCSNTFKTKKAFTEVADNYSNYGHLKCIYTLSGDEEIEICGTGLPQKGPIITKIINSKQFDDSYRCIY